MRMFHAQLGDLRLVTSLKERFFGTGMKYESSMHWHGTHGTYGYRVQKNVAICENHRSEKKWIFPSLPANHRIYIESIPMKDPSFIPGWWFQPTPLKNMKVSQLGS